MTDLYLGLAVLALVSFLAYELGTALAKRACPGTVDFVAVAVVIGLLVYVGALWDDVRLARLLPFTSLIVLGNWFPPATAFFVGLAWHRRGPAARPLRKSLLLGMLMVVAWFSALSPLQGEPPTCRDVWAGEVCLQTSKFSCSAACAATLLRAHGFPATEQEMADLCLTRGGTTWQGLFRGLKWKTLGSEWDVEVFRGTIDDLRGAEGPIILSVKLPSSDEDSFYREECGWIPGQHHSVVFYDFERSGTVRIGEPTFGIEHWRQSDLEYLWTGLGVRLVRR